MGGYWTTAIEFHSTFPISLDASGALLDFCDTKKLVKKHRFIFQPVSRFIRSPMEPMTIGFMSWTEVNRMKWALWSHCRSKGGGVDTEIFFFKLCGFIEINF